MLARQDAYGEKIKWVIQPYGMQSFGLELLNKLLFQKQYTEWIILRPTDMCYQWKRKRHPAHIWRTCIHLISMSMWMFRFCLDLLSDTAWASIDFNSYQVHRVEILLRWRLCKLCGTVICAFFHLQSFEMEFQHVNIIFSINIWWLWPKGPMAHLHTPTETKAQVYIKRSHTQCFSSFFDGDLSTLFLSLPLSPSYSLSFLRNDKNRMKKICIKLKWKYHGRKRTTAI